MLLFFKLISRRVRSVAALIVTVALVVAFSSAQTQAQARNTEAKGSPAAAKPGRSP